MDVSQYLDLFLEESMEHLQTLNSGLLTLENNPEQLDVLDEIFRSAHTLKGMSATMGYDSITQLTHKMENLLDKIRGRKLVLNQDIINTLFLCVDTLESMIESIRNGDTPNAEIKTLTEQLIVLEKGGTFEKKKDEQLKSTKTKEELVISFTEHEKSIMGDNEKKGFDIWKIVINLHLDCVMKGVRAFMVFRNLEKLGEIIKAVPTAQDIEDEKFDHEFILFLVSNSDKTKIEEALNISEVRIKMLEKVTIKKELKTDNEKTEQNKVKEDNKSKETKGQKGILGNRSKNKYKNSMPENKNKIHQTVRVDIGRLDKLMNLVGELVINKTRLEQIYLSNNLSGLNETIEQINRITTDLQSVVQNVRMVSIEQVFNRFPRMVRDLAKETGKEVNLILEGKETELDRTVIDEIGDPLVHLIRNAIDHGLESPETRRNMGKNPVGTLKLSARHDGNQVTICVEDDGKGLDVEAIKKKALAKKILTPAQLESLDEQALVNLIFEAGFSTAQKITDISGRGVGLDVVKSKIQALSGQILVETKKGEGLRFIIKLPLTLAIIQALLVKVQEETFAIPLANIDETSNLETQQIQNIHGQKVMVLRGKVLPLVFVKKILEVPGDSPAEELNVVVVQKGEQKMGLVVEELIGQQEIVISSMGKLLSGLPGIAGASILGDGKISLILDIGTLL